MANDQDDAPWPPALSPEAFREAGEQFTDRQLRLFQQLFAGAGTGAGSTSAGADDGSGSRSRSRTLDDLERLSTETAVFKTRIQSGGRLSVPDAEREALDIDDGDLVQVFVLPIDRHGDSNE
jgi:hypothetical protein